MTVRPEDLTALDVRLLAAIARVGSVVGAAGALGISRDRAVYRLRRLARAFGGPVVATSRGGSAHGTSFLTPRGDRIVRGGLAAAAGGENRLTGVYRSGPPPVVVVGPALRLRVAFPARDGEPVTVAVDPESILVARARFPSSARNVLVGTVDAIRPGPGLFGRSLVVRVGRHHLTAAVTVEPIRTLGLAPGRRAFLYVKATAVRRLGRPTPASRGSPRR